MGGDGRDCGDGLLGVLRPGDAAEQIVGGGRDWAHAVLLVAFSW